MEGFKLGPKLVDRDSIGRVRLKVSSWPMDQVQVNILELELLKRSLERRSWVLEVRHPKFGRDK